MKTILLSLIAIAFLASCAKSKQSYKCEQNVILKGESEYVCQTIN